MTGLTEIACDDDSGVVVGLNSIMGSSELTSGQTYYVQVDGWNGATGAFCISVETVIPPSNDKCSEAENIVQNADCQATAGSISGAGPTPYPGVDCNGLGFQSIANDDVWYSFTATTENVIIDVDANFDAVVEMFEGDDCDVLISTFCADDTFAGLETIVANGLTIGTTYYVRVYSYGDGAVADPTFTICAVSYTHLRAHETS